MADVIDIRDRGLGTGTIVVLRDVNEVVFGSRIEAIDVWPDRSQLQHPQPQHPQPQQHQPQQHPQPQHPQPQHPASITVVRPSGVPASDPYVPGSAFDVLWTNSTGMHVLPTELVATRTERRVRLWDLSVVADPWVEQRREFVRVPAFGRVVVTVATATTRPPVPAPPPPSEPPPTPAMPLPGYLIDFSEAAVQCNLFTEPGNPPLEPGQQVTCEFAAHGTQFRRGGTIHGVRESSETDDTLVVVQFDQDEGEAKALRREVFAAQVDMRRLLRNQG